jgi:hypothetical protein
MALNLTGGKKFLLKFNIDNEEKIEELIKKTQEWNNKMGEYTKIEEDPLTLEIFTDINTYDLWIECTDDSAPFMNKDGKTTFIKKTDFNPDIDTSGKKIPKHIQIKGITD